MKLLHAFKWYPSLAWDRLIRQRYSPTDFWERRHAAGDHNFWTVGRRAFDEAGNREWYGRLEQDLEAAIRADGRDPSTLGVLDVGVGTGYWTRLAQRLGVQTYFGVDIAASAAAWLRPQFPAYRFDAVDVGTQPIPGQWDLVLMMHVDEHIHGDCFRQAMRHILQAMAPGAVFYTTYKTERLPSGVSYVEYHTREDFEQVFSPAWVSPVDRPYNGDPMLRIQRPSALGDTSDA